MHMTNMSRWIPLTTFKSASNDEIALLDTDSALGHKDSDKAAAWKVTVPAGVGVTTFVLVTNISVLALTIVTFETSDGIANVFTGSCMDSRRVTVDLAVNILSTLLLAASNNCAQILSSPTRSDVGRAHEAGKWLVIGVPSIRNLRGIPLWRTSLWILLFTSSIPLHLLYNSLIFDTRQANEYTAYAVTDASLLNGNGNGGTWRDQADLIIVQNITSNLTDPPIQKLTAADCLRNYTISSYLTKWRNLVLVTDATLPLGEDIVNTFSSNWTSQGSPSWPCLGTNASLEAITAGNTPFALSTLLGSTAEYILNKAQNTTYSQLQCDSQILIQDPSSCQDRASTILLGTTSIRDLFNSHQYSLAVDIHCLQCDQDTCLVTTACASGFAPLVNIGDAIESFLKQPETNTSRLGPISASDIRNGTLASPKHIEQTRTTRLGRSRSTVASRRRWTLCIVICTALLVIGLGLLIAGTGNDRVWNFGPFDVNNLVEVSLGLSITANVILANAPQVSVSLAYLFYNNILTCMVLAEEFSRHSRTRKRLRMSRLRGQQRSTFWLQIPYKYSVPMLGASALLHWLIARSLFFVKLEVTDSRGELLQPTQYTGDNKYAYGIIGCAFSPGAAFAALCLWTALVAALIFYSVKRLHPGIPLAGSCSRAISAASHCPRTDTNAATLPLQYGVFVEDDEDGVEHEKVGFFSESVIPLVKLLPYYRYQEDKVHPYQHQAQTSYTSLRAEATKDYAQRYAQAVTDLRSRRDGGGGAYGPVSEQEAGKREAVVPHDSPAAYTEVRYHDGSVLRLTLRS